MTPYRVQAYNTAHDSENKIHDDAVARQFGFTGALVPGVDVYAYMMHLPVARWGREFLERGSARCKFSSPVYDGDTAEVTEQEESGGFGIEVRVNGKLCATGRASLPLLDSDKPRIESYPVAPLPAPEERAPASAASLAKGTVLGTFSLEASEEFVRNYLRDVRETDELYQRERLVHPGTVLRMCNHALVRNVKLGPWIHVGSSIANHGVARIGETLASRARVARHYEHKGHLFVDLDVVVLGNGRPVAQVLHTAIYQPRRKTP